MTKKWDKQNPKIIHASKTKYDANNPIWTLRFKKGDSDLFSWVQSQRLEGESTQNLLVRLLRELMELKR